MLFLCEDGLDFVQADIEHFADLFEAHSFGVEAGDYLISLCCTTFCTTGFVAHLAVGCVLSFESSFVVHIAIIFYAFLLRKTCKSANVITIVSSSKSWLSFSRNVYSETNLSCHWSMSGCRISVPIRSAISSTLFIHHMLSVKRAFLRTNSRS